MRQNAVVIATDAAQFPAALFLAKRLLDLGPPAGTEIVLFSDSLPDLRTAHAWGRVPVDLQMIESTTRFTGAGHVSGATFYRFFLPRLSGAKRVLYLDVDTYPESPDIWKLFDLDLGDHAIAAVRDIEVTCLDSPDKRQELETSHCIDKKYLNAGVMLIDAERYASERLERRLFERVVTMGGHDQNAINFILRGDWTELSPAFNTTPICYLSPVATMFPPAISHFQGVAKPWHGPMFYLDHRARAEIEAFIPTTPWPRFIQQATAARGWRPGMTVNYPTYTPPASFMMAVKDYLATTTFADR